MSDAKKRDAIVVKTIQLDGTIVSEILEGLGDAYFFLEDVLAIRLCDLVEADRKVILIIEHVTNIRASVLLVRLRARRLSRRSPHFLLKKKAWEVDVRTGAFNTHTRVPLVTRVLENVKWGQ